MSICLSQERIQLMAKCPRGLWPANDFYHLQWETATKLGTMAVWLICCHQTLQGALLS